MKKKFLLAFFLSGILFTTASSQTVSPQVINSSGASFSFGYTRFDWSVGEMPLVHTALSDNLLVYITNGFLQPNTDYPANINTSNTFGPDEIRIFPNPASSYVEINFFTKQQGRIGMKLYDSRGMALYQTEFTTFGYGSFQRINLEKWPSGAYYLHIVLEPDSGSVGKKGSYKIIKLQ